MKQNSRNILIGYIILLIVATGTTVLGIYIAKKIQREQTVEVVIIKKEEKPHQYPDYYSIKGKNPDPEIKRLLITKDCPRDICRNDKPATVEKGELEKKFKVTGELSEAYLYIEVAVDYNKLLTEWDDVYFKINNDGGHLIPDINSLPTPPGDLSRYLYNLNSIYYYPTLADKARGVGTKRSLVELFKDGATLEIITFISSDRPGRVMKEIAIYYKCSKKSKCSIDSKK
jgi:hypothetical protein